MSGCEGGSCSTCGGGDDPDRLPPGMLKRYDINQSVADGILVHLETTGSGEGVRLADHSAELIGAARSLGVGRVFGVVFGGPEVKGMYPDAFGYGVDTIYHVRDARLETYMPEAYAECISAVIARIEPAIVLFPATPFGRELAPRVAASIGSGITADCTGLGADGRDLVATRPAFGGSLMADIRYVGYPQVATVRPGAFGMPEREDRKGTAIYWQYPGDSVKDIVSDERIDADHGIEDARVLIALGDGIRDRGLIDVAESVAKKMGGVVCCSRALVERGWMPRSRQVGMSGRIVSPDLYIAFGISGAVQHRVGMTGARRIIAVNSDPDAPIHGFADLSLLADAGEVLRSLDSALRFRTGHGACEDLVHMPVDLDVAPDGLDGPVPADQEGRPDGADGLLAVGDLGAPGADLLHQLVVGVAEELHPELMLVDELPMGFDGVLAHTYHRDVAHQELPDAGAELLGLLGASGRVVLRIEVDHVPYALQRRAVQLLAVLVPEPELREPVADFHGIRLRTGCRSSRR